MPSDTVTLVWPGDLHLDVAGRDTHTIALWMAGAVSSLIKPASSNSLNTLMIDVSGTVNEKVQLTEGTGELLTGITKVIESVRSQENNLLVLSNTARIEGISQERMEYVAKHANLKPHELTNATQFDYARKAEALQRDYTDVENTLEEVAASQALPGAAVGCRRAACSGVSGQAAP